MIIRGERVKDEHHRRWNERLRLRLRLRLRRRGGVNSVNNGFRERPRGSRILNRDHLQGSGLTRDGFRLDCFGHLSQRRNSLRRDVVDSDGFR